MNDFSRIPMLPRSSVAGRAAWKCLLAVVVICGCGEGGDTRQRSDLTVQEISLPAAEYLPGDFTDVSSVRELADGSLIVADRGERVLKRLSLQDGGVEELGRSGEGPGEYRGVDRVLALANDSTMLVDPTNRRVVLMHRAQLLDVAAPSCAKLGSSTAVLGADTLGNWLLGVLSTTRLPGGTIRLDTMVVVRASRDLVQVDTVARLAAGQRAVTRNELYTSIVSHPLGPSEQVLMAPDGMIAVAYLNPYRVSWTRTGAAPVEGSPLPYAPVSMSEQEKASILARFKMAGEGLEWPAALPAFVPIGPAGIKATSGVLSITPDGHLAIRRTVPADSQNVRYDLIDRTGALKGHLSLPANQNVVGFGRQHIYVTATDSLHLQRLYRAAWPGLE